MRVIPASELIIHADGSIFHLHLKPEQLADRIVLVGDPARVTTVASYFDEQECEVQNREFHTITGSYRGKRISVVSHGIGPDNIEIVLNELDALANIDFTTRTVHPQFRQLTMVRIGTSGGLQPNTPVGTFVATEKSIGFNGVLYFYAQSERVRDLALEQALREQLDWQIEGLSPYVVSSDPALLEQIAEHERKGKAEHTSGDAAAGQGMRGWMKVHEDRLFCGKIMVNLLPFPGCDCTWMRPL